MRVAQWLTGLLWQLSLLVTRSWEVRLHPRQGKDPPLPPEARGPGGTRGLWGGAAHPGAPAPSPRVSGGSGAARSFATGSRVSRNCARG